ncbi:polysaccharide pyruvyl transferase family protein [Pseudooceanicola marinus]|uniref:polysaccharide pyruvyl transferase family protein n=1 Tax=Pseudooceanicola marinus TaxID=396013 RepID=UPI001CD1A66F|nr:polysaccharide pyruvyl transferase family protein [Pseudooceanicola marinus]MCA1338153.1 polysaccharide pyruvyl transferase family protein [Pseudooceanicola marinus]
MKRILKALLPTSVSQGIQQARVQKAWQAPLQDWARLAAAARPADKAHSNRILILPSDTDAITGALGDDAMITATVEMMRRVTPDLAVDMLCAPRAVEIVRAKGFTPIILPSTRKMPQMLDKLFTGAPYQAFFALGADIMDGYYSSKVTARILIAADLAVRHGVPATILGCSFNDRPDPQLKPVYEAIDPRVELNMRDEISLERIRAFADVKARLVADSAFTLTPGRLEPEAVTWTEARRAEGRRVLGINVHPMLIRGATPEQVAQIIDTTVAALIRVAGQQQVAYLMLPHDYRGDDGDARCLLPIHQKLQAAGGIESYFLEGEHRAADLKAMAGQLDGVVTGRMHLAIAALGMGVPVLSLTYQDKFEGLYRHFGLPSTLLLPPAVFDQQDRLGTAINSFVTELPALTATVAAAKPGVLALSQANYAPYLSEEALA